MALKIIKANGFSLLELLMVVGISVFIFSSAVPLYSNLYSSGQFGEASAQIVQSLRLARVYSISGYNDNSYGVYFEINQPQGQDRFIFYAGPSFPQRDPTFDRVGIMAKTVLINPSFSGTDINFSKVSGIPNINGLIEIAGAGTLNKNIVISENGFIKIE